MRRSRWLFLLVLIGGLVACAGQAPPGQGAPPPPQAAAPQSPEEALRARATRFWEARLKGDLVTQYELVVPAAREQVTLTGFVRARGSLSFLSYTIKDVQVTGDDGWVTALTTFRMNLPQVSRFGPWDQRAVMRWRKVDDLWYLLYDQQDVKPPLQAGEKSP